MDFALLAILYRFIIFRFKVKEFSYISVASFLMLRMVSVNNLYYTIVKTKVQPLVIQEATRVGRVAVTLMLWSDIVSDSLF